jgi:hypothetical protein
MRAFASVVICFSKTECVRQCGLLVAGLKTGHHTKFNGEYNWPQRAASVLLGERIRGIGVSDGFRGLVSPAPVYT